MQKSKVENIKLFFLVLFYLIGIVLWQPFRFILFYIKTLYLCFWKIYYTFKIMFGSKKSIKKLHPQNAKFIPLEHIEEMIQFKQEKLYQTK